MIHTFTTVLSYCRSAARLASPRSKTRTRTRSRSLLLRLSRKQRSRSTAFYMVAAPAACANAVTSSPNRDSILGRGLEIKSSKMVKTPTRTKLRASHITNSVVIESRAVDTLYIDPRWQRIHMVVPAMTSIRQYISKINRQNHCSLKRS